MSKKVFLSLVMLILASCNMSMQEFFNNPLGSLAPNYRAEPKPLKTRAVVVCRGKQCAPAKLSMSREYVHNSLVHLLENNNHKTALICEADEASHNCTESYVSLPINAGVTPATMYIDAVKISDVMIGRKNKQIDLILNYNVTFNGQSPECIPARSIAYVKTVNNIILEDNGFSCKMTAIGQTSIKVLFAVDYIDLDYGFIGGYYSIGASGPAYGGGTGYMMIRLPKDAYPLAPSLMGGGKGEKSQHNVRELMNYGKAEVEATAGQSSSTNGVQIFPISK